MSSLGQVAEGRDNNFNLIRMAAAVAVLVSHAWPLTYGATALQPLQTFTGHTLGTLAVYVFFLISGFLITASFERRARAGRFLRARALRLLPGLAVSLAFVALLLGPLVTTLPVADYLAHRRTWRFLVANLALVFPQYTLPGVFATNPWPTVEGSIWTLFHEVACYVMVLAAGLVGLLRGRRVLLFIGLYAAAWGADAGLGRAAAGQGAGAARAVAAVRHRHAGLAGAPPSAAARRGPDHAWSRGGVAAAAGLAGSLRGADPVSGLRRAVAGVSARAIPAPLQPAR